MTPAITTQPRLTFEEFLDYDDGTGRRFELIDGLPIPMPEPSEMHEDIAEYLAAVFKQAVSQMGYRWKVKTSRLIKMPIGAHADGRRPDLALINDPEDPETRAIYTPPHLVIEIASRNWAEDLQKKLADYRLMKVPLYWVVDYRGQIPEKHCQRGKGVKTIVFTLQNFNYKREEFIGDEVIPCQPFQKLELTTNLIVNKGEP